MIGVVAFQAVNEPVHDRRSWLGTARSTVGHLVDRRCPIS